MKKKLREIVEDNTCRKGKTFDYVIQTLILISLIVFSLETLPNNSVQLNKILHTIELFCVAIFMVEYVLRIYVAKQPLRYIFSFYGIIDLQPYFHFSS